MLKKIIKKEIKRETQTLCTGTLLLVLFAIWTMLIQTIDVQPAGASGTNVGFATLNCRFHQSTGVHMWIYTMTDWLGLVPIFVCLLFGAIGLIQLCKRKSLLKVDKDLLLLGIYYVVIIFCYLAFEMLPINYRPILIEGRLEASYPSSTTLLVLSVMPTLVVQIKHRLKQKHIKQTITLLTMLFSISMVIGRLIAGVHWVTDIVGAILLSAGLFYLYLASTLFCCKKDH